VKASDGDHEVIVHSRMEQDLLFPSGRPRIESDGAERIGGQLVMGSERYRAVRTDTPQFHKSMQPYLPCLFIGQRPTTTKHLDGELCVGKG
jgi:hypothetical protein